MKRLSGKWLALLFLLPFAAFFVIFQIAPLAWVALNSLKASDAWSLANYLELFGSPFYRQAIRHSLEIAGWSSLLGLLIAVLGSHSLRHV
ncbi:ABC transporter permease, partial [Pseudomonas aeruginosa]